MKEWTERLRVMLAGVVETSSGVTDGQLLCAAILLLASEIHALGDAIAAATQPPPPTERH